MTTATFNDMTMLAAMVGTEPPEPASDIDVYRLVAAGRDEGLPPGLRINVGAYGRDVYLHLSSQQDVQGWRQWLSRRGANQWDESARIVAPYRHNTAVGRWQGWTVELTYLTEVEDGEPSE